MNNYLKYFLIGMVLSVITACGSDNSQENKDDYRLKKLTRTVVDISEDIRNSNITTYKYNNLNQLIEQVTSYGSYTDTRKYIYDINNNLVEEHNDFIITYFYENNFLVKRLTSFDNIVEQEYEVIERVDEKPTLEKTRFFNAEGGALFKTVVRASTYTNNILTHYEETITFAKPIKNGDFDDFENKVITTDIVVGSSSGNNITIENKVISKHVISNNEDKGIDVTNVKTTSTFNDIGLLVSKEIFKEGEDYRHGFYSVNISYKYEYERIKAP